MSGGVDSSTTAAILCEEGYDVIGVMMQLHREGEGRCCTLDDTIDARRVADKLGIPFYIVNLMEPFRKYVTEDFIEKYLSGKTPNPCVLCNRTIKFNLLLKKAISLGANFIATGHYARVIMDEKTGKFSLLKGVDEDKDQSYFLFTLTQG